MLSPFVCRSVGALLLAISLVACQPVTPHDGSATLAFTAPVRAPNPATRLAMAERSARGLPPATGHPALLRAAQDHADWMARAGRMSHRGPGGSSPSDRMRAAGYRPCFGAENVAVGQPDAASVVSAWMRSPGHRRNILAPRAVHAATARAVDGRGRIYWAMLLAAPC
ncbi:MAG: CAP domain-containing protein [Jannaschia sp.]